MLSKPKWAEHISVHSIPFAAGVMLAVALLDVIPEAIEGSDAHIVLRTVLIVMVAAFFFEQFFLHLHHHEEHERTLKTSLPLVVFGDTIHNFVDGLAIAAAYLTDPALGVLVAIATFLHEIPHEMGDFGLMMAGGWSKTKILLTNLLSALATYAGVAATLLFSGGVAGNLPVLLGIAGGLFLYIGASDLLPEVNNNRRDKPWHQAGLLLTGVLIVWVMVGFLPHGG